MPEPGVLGVADAVLDPGVGAVTSLQVGQLPGRAGGSAAAADRGVGGEELVAPAVGLLEQGQLRARVGAFAADDDACPSARS